MLTSHQTICAISTALSQGAISIIRLTGPNAFSIVQKVFLPMHGEYFEDYASHTLHLGNIVHQGEVIDQVLLSIMKAPNTYTGEDLIEINCHGGVLITKKVLEVLLEAGAYLAEPGAFTKRAFLNGKLDLTQAEAVNDLISGSSDYALNIAIKQLHGGLSKYISDLAEQMLSLLSHIEVNIDYPDEVDELGKEKIQEKLVEIKAKIDALLKTADTGRMIKEGIKTVIIGKPNVGKSSLLNRLLKYERAIVTDVAGTTRDTLEELLNLDGIPIRLVDTAGIRETPNEVERIGIRRTRDWIKEADLVLCMFDASNALTEEDFSILALVRDKKTIGIINKTDLPSRLDTSRLEGIETIQMSIQQDTGIVELEDKIKELFFKDQLSVSNDLLITNIRHKESLIKARECIQKVLEEIERVPEDLLSIDLTNAYAHLRNITGENVSEDIIHSIFHHFCVGK